MILNHEKLFGMCYIIYVSNSSSLIKTGLKRTSVLYQLKLLINYDDFTQPNDYIRLNSDDFRRVCYY